MKLKLYRSLWENTGKCYPNTLSVSTMDLWWHLFPEDHACEDHYHEQYISQVEFLARAHGWEIEWMKD